MSREGVTFIVEVEGDKPDKRQQLSGGLDFAMCSYGMRVTAGEYEVTVRRLTVSPSEKSLLRDILAFPQRLYPRAPAAALRLLERHWVEHTIVENGCHKFALTKEGEKQAKNLGAGQ